MIGQHVKKAEKLAFACSGVQQRRQPLTWLHSTSSPYSTEGTGQQCARPQPHLQDLQREESCVATKRTLLT